MVRRVEDRELGYVRQRAAGRLDARERGRVVQRGEHRHLADRVEYGVVDRYRRPEPGAPVDDPVADRADLLAP